MLTLTPTAAEAVRKLVTGAALEPDGGLRISPGDPIPTGTPLNVEMASGPETTDQTVVQEGATVFVEPHVAEFLDDKVLDAAVDSGRVRFAIIELDAGEPGQSSPPE